MSKDWQAVSDAISTRLDELEMTQAELSHRAGVALETVRELHRNLKPRRRSPRTRRCRNRGRSGRTLRACAYGIGNDRADSP